MEGPKDLGTGGLKDLGQNRSKGLRRAPERILISALHNLGDAVMGTCLLPPLRRLYPQAELGLWVKDYAKEVFDFPEGSVTIHACDPFWDVAPGRDKGRLAAFLSVLKDIRARHYDTVFVLDSDWRRAGACWLAGIPERVGYSRHKSRLFLTQALSEKKDEHVIEGHARLLSAWAKKPLPLEWFIPEIGLSQAQKDNGTAWRKNLGWEEETLIVLHLIGADPARNWPLKNWAALIAALCAQFNRLRIAVLSSQREEETLRGALSQVPGERVRIVSGTLSKMKEVIAQADFFISGDSGPSHIAAALGIPALSIFVGPTIDPARYRPIGKALSRVIRRRPPAVLGVEEVRNAVSELLAKAARPVS